MTLDTNSANKLNLTLKLTATQYIWAKSSHISDLIRPPETLFCFFNFVFFFGEKVFFNVAISYYYLA
jgi:hypothetical protein